MSKVLLVGNSPKLLGKGLGSVIDTYDEVVRFNNFEIKGFEKDVGTKSTVLARRSCDDVKMHPADMFEKVLCFVTYCRYTRGMEQVAKQILDSGFYGDKFKIVPVDFCKQIGEDMGLNQPDEHATIGALTVGYYHYLNYEIDICGFDYLKSNAHYFGRQPKDAKFHNKDGEEAYITSIVNIID